MPQIDQQSNIDIEIMGAAYHSDTKSFVVRYTTEKGTCEFTIQTDVTDTVTPEIALVTGDFDGDGKQEIAYNISASRRNQMSVLHRKNDENSLSFGAFHFPSEDILSYHDNVGVAYAAECLPAGDILVSCPEGDMRSGPDTDFAVMIRDHAKTTAEKQPRYDILPVDYIDTISGAKGDVLICRQPIVEIGGAHSGKVLGYVWFGLQWDYTNYDQDFMWFPYRIVSEWIQLANTPRDALRGYKAPEGWPWYAIAEINSTFYNRYRENGDVRFFEYQVTGDGRGGNLRFETGTQARSYQVPIGTIQTIVACDLTGDGIRDILLCEAASGPRVLAMVDGASKVLHTWMIDVGDADTFLGVDPVADGYRLGVYRNGERIKQFKWDDNAVAFMETADDGYYWPIIA